MLTVHGLTGNETAIRRPVIDGTGELHPKLLRDGIHALLAAARSTVIPRIVVRHQDDASSAQIEVADDIQLCSQWRSGRSATPVEEEHNVVLGKKCRSEDGILRPIGERDRESLLPPITDSVRLLALVPGTAAARLQTVRENTRTPAEFIALARVSR